MSILTNGGLSGKVRYRFLILMTLLVSVGVVIYAVIISVPRPALPAVGDKAIYWIHYGQNGEQWHAFSKGKWCQLLIRCVERKDNRAAFDVYYPVDGELGRVRYSVRVDYATDALDTKTVVTDTRGRKVKRGVNVDGVPVPFTDVLAFRRKVAHPRQEASDAVCHVDDGRSAFCRWWRMRLFYKTSTPPDQPGSYMEYQYWGRRKWLWTSASRYGNPYGGYEFVVSSDKPRHLESR